MNGRERLLAAMNHKEPDRVPRDLGATPSSGISAIAYNRFVRHMGWKAGPARIYDVVQQLAQPADVVLDQCNIDVLDAGRAFNAEESRWKAAKLSDGSDSFIPAWFDPKPQPDGGMAVFSQGRMIARMPYKATFYDGTYVAYPDEIPGDLSDLDEQMDRVLWQKMATPPWDRAQEKDFWPNLRAAVLKLRGESDRALVIGVGCNLFEWGTFLRRIDNFLCDLLLDPEGVERLLDALMERHLASLGKVCEWLGDVCDVVKFGDDLGMDTGPLMQPDIYRQLFKPRHKMLNDYAHRYSGMKTLLHSCGSIHSLLPDMIEAGFDAVNPVQINARDMEPRRLKKEFGKDITFWGGGVNTRVVLNGESPQKVRDQVRENLDVFAPGGGFVFAAVHNILPDVPPENIEAMYQALDEYA